MRICDIFRSGSLFFLIILFSLYKEVCALQSHLMLPGSLKGKITDASTCLPLSHASISITGTSFRAVSDMKGDYLIENIPPGIYEVKISLVGYDPVVREKLNLLPQENIGNFSLRENPAVISEILVKPNYYREDFNEFIGSSRLGHEDLKRIPGNMEDVIKSASIFPGVAQISNYYNDFIVKGGGPAENLFIIDGIIVSNINHYGNQANSGGFLSYINMDYVKSISFSTGGFSTSYGDKISSAMEINMRSGNAERFTGKLSLSATQFALNIEGPAAENTSFIISARKSYLDLVFKSYGFSFAPQYYDFFAKFNTRVDNNNSLSLLFIGVLDDIKFFDNKYYSAGGNARAIGSYQKHFITGLSYNNIFDSGFLNLNLSNDFLDYSSASNLLLANKSTQNETRFRMEMAVKVADKSELDFGAGVRVVDYNNSLRLNKYSTTFGEILQLDQVKTRTDFMKSDAYFQFTQFFGSRLKVNAGMRADFFDGTNEGVTSSPRFYSQYLFSDNTSLALSLGIYRQTPEYLWLSANPVNKKLKSITSRQIHAEFGHSINGIAEIKAGGFIKSYSDYPASTLRPYLVMTNTGSGLSGVDDNFAGSGLDPLISVGQGHVRGLELFIQKKYSEDPFWGSLSLTYSKAEFKGLDGVMRPGSFDQRWIFIITAGYEINSKWEVDAKFRFASGTPYTPFDPCGMQSGEAYNSVRLKNEHSFDIRIDRKWELKHLKLRTFLDIQNIYNHKVRTLIRWDYREKKIADDPVLGIVPSVGISMEL